MFLTIRNEINDNFISSMNVHTGFISIYRNSIITNCFVINQMIISPKGVDNISITLRFMFSLVFFQRREQQLIHAHTERFCISLDLLTLSLWDVDTDIIVMPFEVLRVRS